MLTEAEQFEIVSYLGYPATVLVSGTVNYDKIVYDRLQAVPEGALPILRSYLERLRKIDKLLCGALTRMSTKEVDDIVLRDGEADLLRKEKKMLINEVGALVDITPIVKSGAMIGVCV